MSRINFKKVLAVSLLATIGLTACDKDIQAKPTNYDDKLLAFSSDDDIYHNMVSLVEDAYRDGSLASDVLDEVLYQYAVSVFGRYNKTAKPYNLGEGEITLKAAAADIAAHPGNTAAATIAGKFIEEHKAYQSLDDDGNRKTDAASVEAEFSRVTAKWQTIEERISISLYDDIIGGSYSERELFSEKKFLKSLRSGLHKVRNPYELTDGTDMKKDIVFNPSVEDKEVFGNYLIRDNYQSNYAIDAAEDQDAAVRYVEEEIIPIIYRTLLVEQYLLDESYTTLGRSYARKVNILAIPTNSNNDKAATYMMKDFVENFISDGNNEVTLDTFNVISALNVGTLEGINAYNKLLDPTAADFANLEAASALMTNLGYELKETGDNAYYNGTDYGDMMMKYLKIKDNVITTDSSAESEFSGSYTYTYDVGLEIEERKLQNKDYTQNGWYIKNGGLTSLPDEIRTRLFNIGVANVLDKDGVADRWNNGAYSVPEGENNLVAKINGKYYLKVASKQAGADAKDDILFSSNGTYYVVQIEEAISASKLAKDNTTSYADSDHKEEIINEVAKIIAADDSYKTLSTKHWLEKAAIKYHDTKVYDYFKTNYPELFEDEDK